MFSPERYPAVLSVPLELRKPVVWRLDARSARDTARDRSSLSVLRAVSSSLRVSARSAALLELTDAENPRLLMPGRTSVAVVPSANVLENVPLSLTVVIVAAPPVNEGAVFHWFDCRLKLERFM